MIQCSIVDCTGKGSFHKSKGKQDMKHGTKSAIIFVGSFVTGIIAIFIFFHLIHFILIEDNQQCEHYTLPDSTVMVYNTIDTNEDVSRINMAIKNDTTFVYQVVITNWQNRNIRTETYIVKHPIDFYYSRNN